MGDRGHDYRAGRGDGRAVHSVSGGSRDGSGGGSGGDGGASGSGRATAGLGSRRDGMGFASIVGANGHGVFGCSGHRSDGGGNSRGGLVVGPRAAVTAAGGAPRRGWWNGRPHRGDDIRRSCWVGGADAAAGGRPAAGGGGWCGCATDAVAADRDDPVKQSGSGRGGNGGNNGSSIGSGGPAIPPHPSSPASSWTERPLPGWGPAAQPVTRCPSPPAFLPSPAAVRGSSSCGICFQPTPAAAMTPAATCGHRYCRGCLATHWVIQVRERCSRRPRCPHPGCESVTSNEHILAAGGPGAAATVRRLRYLRSLAPAAGDPTARWCASEACRERLPPPPPPTVGCRGGGGSGGGGGAGGGGSTGSGGGGGAMVACRICGTLTFTLVAAATQRARVRWLAPTSAVPLPAAGTCHGRRAPRLTVRTVECA